MEVRNTFIDMPATPNANATPLPSPMATAPAKCLSGGVFSLKESLADAAVTEDGTLGRSKPTRTRRMVVPSELNFMSTQSMMSIMESPGSGQIGNLGSLGMPVQVGQPVQVRERKTAIPNAMNFASGGTIPPTPIGMMDFGASPTNTPMGGGGYTMFSSSLPTVTMPTVTMSAAPAMAAPTASMMMSAPSAAPMAAPVMMAAPVAAPISFTKQSNQPKWAEMTDSVPFNKQTLSLVDMISPKGDTKVTMLPPTFSQMYAQPSQPPPPPQYQPVLQGQPNFVVSQAPAGPPVGMPMLAAPAFPAPQELSMPSYSSAAVMLGLMSAPTTVLQAQSPTSIAVGTLPTQVMSQPPQYLPPQSMSLPASAAPVTYMASQHGPVSMSSVNVNSQPQSMNRRMIPPPPLAQAPMTVFSPKGSAPPFSPPGSIPTSPQEDLKVLLDMAVMSGNQKAVEALMRQSGMSQDQFNSMMAPKQATVVMSTSPVSR